jgi:N6-L-threonylcarbamoyladenine synthase
MTKNETQPHFHPISTPSLCADNAVMGAIAVERYRAGCFESLDLDVMPGLVRKTR